MNSYEMFIAVAELKSFSLAAKKLHRSPSAISKQVALLEENMGVKLFHRTTRSLSITSAGQIYYERCLDIALRMSSAEEELRDLAAEPSGKLNITWPNVLTNTSVISGLGEFCQMFPEIKLNVSVTPEILNLTEAKMDFAFRVSMLDDTNLVAAELGSIQPIICAAPSLLSRYGMPGSVADIMALPHVIPTYVNLAQAAKKMFPEVKGFENRFHHEVSDITALRQLAKLGLGAAFVGRHVVQDDLDNGELINLTGEMLPKLPIYLVYTKQDFLPKKNRCFIDFFNNRVTKGCLR